MTIAGSAFQAPGSPGYWRCGGFANRPFCDDTHEKIGFVAK